MIKRVLITGGAGFVGSNLALELIHKGYSVIVLDNLSPQIHGDNSGLLTNIVDDCEFVLGDVRNRTDWKNCLKGVDVVVHLAAETGTGQSMYEIEKYIDVNVKGTAILLDILANEKHNVQKVIVASSRSIYGEGKYKSTIYGEVYPDVRRDADMKVGDFEVKCPVYNTNLDLLPTDEKSKIHPSSIYGITKQTQEQMVLTACQSLGISALAFRYQNVFGPGQSLSNPYTGILSIFSNRILHKKGIEVFEDGLQSRDFVFIDDVVTATVSGIESSNEVNGVFNVGSGVPQSVSYIVDQLLTAFKISVPVNINAKYRLGDIRHNYADLTKVQSTFGFQPSVSFENGINQFVKWVLTQELEEDKYDQSIQEMKDRGLYK